METQLNNILYILLVTLFVSCKKDINNKNLDRIRENRSAKSSQQINFLDSKYKNNLRLNIDGSSRSDHPFYSYLNCKNEGYFAVHYIPKSESLTNYWKNRFFQENTYEYDDITTEDRLIRKQLNEKSNDYLIFSCLIEKANINQSKNCTEESLSLKKDSNTKIYLFNNVLHTWEFLKEIKTENFPPYLSISFFRQNFPDIFVAKDFKGNQAEGFFVLDSNKVGYNNDHYQINVLEKINKKNVENIQHTNLPIIIKKNGNDFLRNSNLIFEYDDNCPADGFQRIISKNNYFTIEQTYCKDFMLVSSYTTFKIDQKEILLHKYGEEYTDRSNPDRVIKNLVKTTEDFGKVKFESVNTQMLLYLSNNH